MEYNFLTNIETCYVDIPSLLYYSHIPTAIFALFFGFFILSQGRENRLAKKIFFSISVTFAVWILVEGAIWFLYNSVHMMFLWSFLGMLYALMHLLSIYFVYAVIDKEAVSSKIKYILAAILLPIVYLTPTKYNITGFDIENCQALEGGYFIAYRYLIGVISILWILVFLYLRHRKADSESRKQIILLGFGILSFLLLFSWSEITASLTQSFEITQYGLLGMPVLMAFLAYLIVKFHTFDIRLIAAQALVWGLALLIGAQFFFIKVPINAILNSVAFVATIIFGYALVKSVQREIVQKEQLEILNLELADLIKQRENLVHLVTHKVKGAFTHSKYIFAGMLDGTFGKISPEIKKRAEQGLDSDDMGIETVDLVLNVANMQKGNIKYDMAVLDFKELVLKIISEKKPSAEAKGLVMETSIAEGNFHVLGDIFWMKEVVHNLIENSIRYTREGKIIVSLERKENKILFSVKDTGVGITPEDKVLLFTEGGRGKDSVNVNIDSTGYGLYSVKLILDAHKGKVWAESEGAGKGSTFFVELGAV